MSKGSARRPSQIPREKYADRYDRTFTIGPAVCGTCGQNLEMQFVNGVIYADSCKGCHPINSWPA
jgi:predicted Zn-ribbon and HTH transcriptional regulator